MKLPSIFVLRRTIIVTLIAAAISISFSTGIRFLTGSQSDTITIIIRIILPFIIAFPIGLIWFAKLEKLDLSYRKLLKEVNILAKRANTDPLTGLLNRASFIEQFELAMSHQVPGTFLFIDIDYLKYINDKYGHLVGDEAILATAHAMRIALNDDSLVARIGGDEFCAFIKEMDKIKVQKKISTLQKLSAEYFSRSTKITDISLCLTCSFVVCKPHHTFKNILYDADLELYRNKRARKPVIKSA